MDSEKIQKRQSLKVIVSEIIMVITVIVTVAILALVVSGYWVNSDFKVERNGMLQIASTPTGADVTIDGETSSWLQRTNTSRVLASGEHEIILSKEGYDAWSRTINISEGLLYRVHYPRLFLQNRQPESVLDTTATTFATISPDGSKLLLAGDTTEWSLINLSHDTITPQKLNIAAYFSNVSLADGAATGLFTGQIISADWDHDSSHILFQIRFADATEWVLLDVNNLKNSLNLTKEFGTSFDTVKILDNSSSNLLAIQDHNLHKIDVPGKLISAVLAENVLNFDHYENEIVYVTTDSEKYAVNIAKIGDEKITQLEVLNSPAKVTISKFYDNMYLTVLQNDQVSLYLKDDFSKVSDFNLSFSPSLMKVGHQGEFITMYEGTQIATLDMEARAVREWSVDGGSFGWLDNDMIYSVASGQLVVYDFDGLNRRVLAQNASGHFPTTVTDNKWLYYFSDGSLIREKITD